MVLINEMFCLKLNKDFVSEAHHKDDLCWFLTGGR